MKSISPLSFILAFTEIPVKSPGELEAKFLHAKAPQNILKQEMHARCLSVLPWGPLQTSSTHHSWAGFISPTQLHHQELSEK